MALMAEPIRLEVPHEQDQWMELRALSWKQLKDARKVAERENREVIKELGGEILKALSSPGGDENARKLMKQQEYDPRSFDTAMLLQFGIAAWSYERDLDEKSIEQLDERTAVWAKEEIIGLTKPPDEEAQKNS